MPPVKSNLGVQERSVKAANAIVPESKPKAPSAPKPAPVLASSLPVQPFKESFDEPFLIVILTRFQQLQPDLIELGLARLDLLKTFCLPTLLLHQTNPNFLWLIRTDPDLVDEVKKPLVESLQGRPNFVLLADNANSKDRFGGKNFTDPKAVWSGSREYLQKSFKHATTDKAMIQVVLDADDGLNVNFVEILTNQAKLVKLTESTRQIWCEIWCVPQFLEWHLHHQSRTQSKVATDQYGHLFPGRSVMQRGCITAGLSFIWGTSTKRTDFPLDLTHTTLNEKMERCQSESAAVEKTDKDFCLGFLVFQDEMAAAIKARTPTSASMAGLYLESKEGKEGEKLTKKDQKAWKDVEDNFGMSRSKVAETKTYFESHLTQIAADNLKGQCRTNGYSCRDEAKALLAQLSNSTEAAA